MSPPARPVARHLRRSSVLWALTWALLLPFPSAVDARPAESLDRGAQHGSPGSAEVAAAPEQVGPVGILTGVGAPGPGGVTGMLVALVLLVVSANVAGMLLARTQRFRRRPSTPRFP